MVFELTGKPSKIDAFLVMFQDYDILEMCRTGVTAIERGGMHQHMQKPKQEISEIDYPTYGPGGTRAEHLSFPPTRQIPRLSALNIQIVII